MDWGKDGVVIDREKLYKVSDGLGFKLHVGRIVQSDCTYIEEVTDRHFFDTIKEYIHEEDADLYRDICNAYESFIEKHGRFTISRLPLLNDEMVLHDTINTAYKCYQNGILEITADTVTLLPQVPFLIWRHNVKDRNYNKFEGGRYVDFLEFATGGIDDYLLLIIGYLAHEYKDSTTGYIIVLTERCEDPSDGGGAGKNVFSELLKYTTSFLSKPGSQVKYDEKFLQSWNFQKIFCLSDVPKNFDFSFLKELSTGTGLMKKLFKDEQEINSSDMPKYLVSTNYSFKITDGGLKRRIRQIEFTDFFTKTGGVNKYFDGIFFPDGWNDEDWAGYDTFIVKSIQHWLVAGRSIPEAELSDSGWLKQFEQVHGEILSVFISENIEAWVSRGFVSTIDFNEYIDKFFREHGATARERERFTSYKINNALKFFCKKKEILFTANANDTKGRSKDRGRMFSKKEELPF